MKRNLRTKLLIEIGRHEAIQFAKQILNTYQVEEIQPPKLGLTMIKIRESAKQSLFYIGEVLITETKVKIQASFGIGIVIEEDEDLSRALAIIDAVYKENLPEAAILDKELEELEVKYHQKQEQMKCSVERTKVNFETMKI
ncbi:phosphonate C-P lyase system protein PhnG [Lysinibacillus yapensis]|uniref:Phosphonate C-P lyase system protein PhnG n=1 Tax=Ureibacillus yapensis TaxID=2304605 RepID=A0A396SL23_9BACL|nr:phosphonate C-P lyase system protein PhnG [Lysinibacillus yapensis]RHW35918.1 phosphonate C-P lyase system protein PhnG [Lysinibacillus yapensis]